MATDGEGGVGVSNAQFFDSLASLVPPRFYHGHEGEAQNLRYMKKGDRASAKVLMKAQGKANKRAKLDPNAKQGPPANVQLGDSGDSSSSGSSDEDDDDSTDKGGDSAAAAAAAAAATAAGPSEASNGDGALPSGKRARQQAGQGGDKKVKGGQNGGVSLAAASASGTMSVAGGVAREELMQRLHRRLEAVRAQRNAGTKTVIAQKAKGWRDAALQQSASQRQAAANGRPAQGQANGQPAQDGAGRQGGRQGSQQQQQQQQQQAPRDQQQPHLVKNGKAAGRDAGTAAGPESDGADEFKSGRVEVQAAVIGTHAAKQKRRPPTAVLLKQAEERQVEAMQQPQPAGQAPLAAWDSAMKRARGDKVLDDPKLLRRTLKKEAKAAKKKGADWKKRESAVAGQQQQRQQKRTDNLQARATSKFDTRKAKREKKLSGGGGGGGGGGQAPAAPRAGFEGRKTGFIGSRTDGPAKGGKPA